jgi:hypothetical protein
MTPYVLTTEEVAKIFKCSSWKILAMVKSGNLKPIAGFGRPYRFDLNHIAQVMQEPSNRSLTLSRQVLAAKSKSPKKKGETERLWLD